MPYVMIIQPQGSSTKVQFNVEKTTVRSLNDRVCPIFYNIEPDMKLQHLVTKLYPQENSVQIRGDKYPSKRDDKLIKTSSSKVEQGSLQYDLQEIRKEKLR
jgi:hypothetical protein